MTLDGTITTFKSVGTIDGRLVNSFALDEWKNDKDKVDPLYWLFKCLSYVRIHAEINKTGIRCKRVIKLKSTATYDYVNTLK